MTGEPTTACQTGGLRARHRPRTASRAFDGAIHTEAWPGPVATRQSAARGGLGDCRSYSWSWARPRCAGRWLTRGGAAKRGLPRATMKPPRCGSERLRAFVHNGFAIGDRPCETVHPWNKYRNRDQGGLSCPFTSPRRRYSCLFVLFVVAKKDHSQPAALIRGRVAATNPAPHSFALDHSSLSTGVLGAFSPRPAERLRRRFPR